MREQIFRGKRIDNGAWVEGLLLYQNDSLHEKYRLYIKRSTSNIIFEIDPNTLGRYVELEYCGKKIFEGDILLFSSPRHGDANIRATIKYSYFSSDFTINWIGKPSDKLINKILQWFMITQNNFKLIGNIYDNPKLLGVRK